MIIFYIVSVVVPLIVYAALPRLLNLIYRNDAINRSLLIYAGLLFFIAWYLPSPDIQGEFTAATTHFIGGGLFTGFVWLYVKRHVAWSAHWALELLSLIALVSMLGVANELFELLIVTLKFVDMTLADTSWDLLMNTFGALTFWAVYMIAGHGRGNKGK